MFYGQYKTDKHISDFFPIQYTGTCIDIGAARPTKNSNTYYFETRGWTTYCIEPNPYYTKDLLAKRLHVFPGLAIGSQNLDQVEFTVCTLAGGNQEAVSSLKIDPRLLEKHQTYQPTFEKVLVKLQTLDSFIETNSIGKIDFISIDTEGTEADVLSGFDIAKYSPHLLVIENNFNDAQIETYLGSFGYKKRRKIVMNDFYTR